MENNNFTNETPVIYKTKTGKEVKLYFQKEFNFGVKEAILEILLDAYANRIQDYNRKDKKQHIFSSEPD